MSTEQTETKRHYGQHLEIDRDPARVYFNAALASSTLIRLRMEL